MLARLLHTRMTGKSHTLQCRKIFLFRKVVEAQRRGVVASELASPVFTSKNEVHRAASADSDREFESSADVCD